MVDSRAGRRLALTIAVAIAIAAFVAKPLHACELMGCSPGASGPNLGTTAANALPTYAQPAEEAAEPVALRKFSRSQTRVARRAQPRTATLSQRARAGKYTARKAKPVEVDDEETGAPVRAMVGKKMAPSVANAKAELVEADATANSAAAEAGNRPQPAAAETQAGAARPPAIELVSADEFNDLDRVAWEANQMPKLMQLTASNSRAELRDDDSRWAQTSIIGKLFVALGALLTIGSAIRMFMA